MCISNNRTHDIRKGNCEACEQQALYLLQCFSEICKELTTKLGTQNVIPVDKRVSSVARNASVSVKRVVYHKWENHRHVT